MANEATWIEDSGNTLTGMPISYTVANGTAISKGTILIISSDPRTALASSGINQVFAGIANADKEANDGATRIGANTFGVYDLTMCAGGAGSTGLVGDLVELSGANLIRTVQARGVSGSEFISGAKFAFGRLLETASASEVVAVKIPY